MSDKLFRRIKITPEAICCVACSHGDEQRAYFIYRGDSLCRGCYDKIKEFEKCNNKTIGYQP